MMKSEYNRLIEEKDKIIAEHREFWIHAKSPAERAKHMNRINECLDERNRLMRCRNALSS